MSEPTLESVDIVNDGEYEIVLIWSNSRYHRMLLPVGKSKLHLCRALYKLIHLIEDDIELQETFSNESS